MTEFKLRRAVGVHASVVGEELRRIHDANGRLTPEIVVDDARPAEAPLHPAFTWDDAKAAEEFRLMEARDLIRAVHLVEEDGTDRGCAYAHVSIETEDGEGRGYYPVEQIVQDSEMLGAAIESLAKKQQEAAKALADLEREARRTGARHQIAGIGKARMSTEAAAKELAALI